jgi:hypothetical protein
MPTRMSPETFAERAGEREGEGGVGDEREKSKHVLKRL